MGIEPDLEGAINLVEHGYNHEGRPERDEENSDLPPRPRHRLISFKSWRSRPRRALARHGADPSRLRDCIGDRPFPPPVEEIKPL